MAMGVRVWSVVAVSVGIMLSFGGGGGWAQESTGRRGAGVRVGVYDSRAVAVCYYRSPAFTKQLQELKREEKEAEVAKDAKTVEEIRQRGANMQRVAHLQGFSVAPVGEAMASIKERLPGVAKAAGVSVIVDGVDYQGAGVEVVDVTEQLVAEFGPDEQTRKVIAGMKGKKPITLLEAVSMKD